LSTLGPCRFISGKNPIHVKKEARWAPEPVWKLWTREDFPAPSGIRILASQKKTQLYQVSSEDNEY
jgi:hypothetical protein